MENENIFNSDMASDAQKWNPDVFPLLFMSTRMGLRWMEVEHRRLFYSAKTL